MLSKRPKSHCPGVQPQGVTPRNGEYYFSSDSIHGREFFFGLEPGARAKRHSEGFRTR